MLNENSDYERLLNYAFWLISRRRYTCFEINKKLRQFLKKHKLEGESLIENVLNRLLELKYLDDQQYAQDYVSDRIKFRPIGKFLMKKELKSKGIAPEIISAILNHIDVDEFGMVLELLKKKRFHVDSVSSPKEKAKVYRFLASKGFDKEIIYKAVESQYNRN